jgi:chemotaxis signal transduction protein
MSGNNRLPYVIASVSGMKFAISSAHVQQILKVPAWHAVPRLPRCVRGVISFRDTVIPLVDLRLRMDMRSSIEEDADMVQTLHAREQDHVRWLQELEASIVEHRPFTLTRDPTQCAFGRWYHGYKSDDMGFAAVMQQFDMPHRRIHAIADAALDFVAQGEPGKAMALIESTRSTELQEVRRLFGEAREVFVQSRNELAVVLAVEGRPLAVTVDRVDAVEVIDEAASEDARTLLGDFRSDFVERLFRRAGDKGVAYLIEPGQLLANAPAAA